MANSVKVKKRNSVRGKKIRYAAVGLGYIAQNAVLPAFAHAHNSELTALVSDNPTKLKRLSKKYCVSHTYSYEELFRMPGERRSRRRYIALPNHMHRDYTEAAAGAGVHVLFRRSDHRLTVFLGHRHRLFTKAEQELREKMMDKTLADSYPASDPPSSIPDPAEDDSAA